MEKQIIKEKVMEMMSNVPFEKFSELIIKSRWTCDSHWMMALVANAGWDAANKSNLQVSKTVGNVEMNRLMKVIGIGKPKNDEEVELLLTLAMETFVTKDYFDYEFKPGVAIIHQCYANTKVNSIGVGKDYECGCSALRAGWYQAMGVEVKERMVKCLKDGDDRCEIYVDDIVFPS